jgi:GNAT superfamily N-acetyltransferase
VNFKKCRTDEDISNFLYLHTQVFDSWDPNSLDETFNWKYVENPFVNEVSVYLLYERGNLVAARGYLVAPVYGLKQAMGYQSADLMVHPGYQGQGVFKALNRYCSEVHAEGRKRLLFSFPRPRPRKGYAKGGWEIYPNNEYKSLATPKNPWRLQAYPSVRSAGLHGSYLATRLTSHAVLARLGRFGSYESICEPVQERHMQLATTLEPYQQNITYERSRRFYAWRLSEPLKEFRAVTLYKAGEEVGLALLNEQWGGVYIRELLVRPSSGISVYAMLLREVVRHFGTDQEYTLWSNLPEAVLSLLGFINVHRRDLTEFNHDIAVRGYNLTDKEQKRVHRTFSQGKSGLSLLDFDC